jgi:hypothetical protein
MTRTHTNYKPITKAEAKRRIVRARGVQTVSFAFYNNEQGEWIRTRVANPNWRRLDKVQATSLNLGGIRLDLDSKTEVFEVDDTRLSILWHHDNGDFLSMSIVSLVPLG